MADQSNVTDTPWEMLEPLLVLPSKRGPKHGADLRHVVDAMLYISHAAMGELSRQIPYKARWHGVEV